MGRLRDICFCIVFKYIPSKLLLFVYRLKLFIIHVLYFFLHFPTYNIKPITIYFSRYELWVFKTTFSSETAWPNGAKLGRKHLCKILYNTSSFGSNRPTNMAAVTKNITYGKIEGFWVITQKPLIITKILWHSFFYIKYLYVLVI